MNELSNQSIYLSMMDSIPIILSVISSLTAIFFINLYASCKKQTNIDAGIIASNLVRLENQDEEIKILEENNNGLLRNLLSESAKLLHERIQVVDLKDEIAELKKRNEYLKAVKNHKKRPVDVTKSDTWKSTSTSYPQFPKNGIFIIGKNTPSQDNLLILTATDGTDYMVEKKHFKPIK